MPASGRQQQLHMCWRAGAREGTQGTDRPRRLPAVPMRGAWGLLHWLALSSGRSSSSKGASVRLVSWPRLTAGRGRPCRTSAGRPGSSNTSAAAAAAAMETSSRLWSAQGAGPWTAPGGLPLPLLSSAALAAQASAASHSSACSLALRVASSGPLNIAAVFVKVYKLRTKEEPAPSW